MTIKVLIVDDSALIQRDERNYLQPARAIGRWRKREPGAGVRGVVPEGVREQVAVLVIILAIALSDWVQYARTVRGAVMVEKQKDYVLAAQLIGRSRSAILGRHILPNLLAPILVIAAISFAHAIVAESTLSYLGVGLPPTQPSLGTLIRIGQSFLFSGEWWILLFPSLVLLALALSVNLVGDWLRDALNPKLQ